MKRNKDEKVNRDVVISYRVTQEQKELLMAVAAKKGFASLSQFFNYKLFTRQSKKLGDFDKLKDAMLVKCIIDLRYQLASLSRAIPETSQYQEKFIEINKIIHQINDDIRRQRSFNA